MLQEEALTLVEQEPEQEMSWFCANVLLICTMGLMSVAPDDSLTYLWSLLPEPNQQEPHKALGRGGPAPSF